MSEGVQIAVVGHTNAGKTSLLRTLTRQSGFGEVSDGAAKTVYVRLEQVGSGTDTFDAVSGRGFFGARVEPLR